MPGRTGIARFGGSNITVTGHNTISGYTSTTEWVDRKMFLPPNLNGRLRAYHFIDGKTQRRLVLDFDTKPGGQVEAKVAISAVSVDGAKQNLIRNGSINHLKLVKADAAVKHGKSN